MSILIIGAIAFLSACSNKSRDLTFNDFDDNDNNLISLSEFTDRFKENYETDWNLIDDNHLDDEDFYIATYEVWDVDNDDLLSADEWNHGYNYYYGEYVNDDYVAIDTNGDGFIDYAEYYGVFNGTDYFPDWDLNRDTYLSEEEIAENVFSIWDMDNSNYLEVDEYKQFDAAYMDI